MMFPRSFLPIALFTLAGVLVLLTLPAQWVALVGLGAIAGACSAIAFAWSLLPGSVRPWVREAVRARLRV